MGNTSKVTKAVKLPNGGAAQSAPASLPEAPRFLNEAGRSAIIPLESPLEYDGVQYASLTARKLKGADLLKIKQDSARGLIENQEIYLYALMCDVPAAVISSLDADDYAAMVEKSADFLPRYVRTAAEPTGDAGQSSQQT